MSKLIQQHIDTAAVRLQKAVQQDGKIDAKRSVHLAMYAK